MARFPLASNSDWELTNDDQDIRGWEVRDGTNSRLGEVTEMLVNTKTETVDVIRLDNGRELATADMHLGDHIVYWDVVEAAAPPGAIKVYDGYGQLARRVVLDEAAFTGYEPAFRSHYGETFATTGWVYEFYLPAYRLGYVLASDEANIGRTFEQVEPRMREDFIRRHGNTEYADNREAIRYGYEHHRERLAKGGV